MEKSYGAKTRRWYILIRAIWPDRSANGAWKGGTNMPKTHQFIINGKGEKTGVILDIQEYESLLENLHDLRVFEERKNDAVVSFEEFDRQMRGKGGLSNRSKK
jgi:hypothetical protein